MSMTDMQSVLILASAFALRLRMSLKLVWKQSSKIGFSCSLVFFCPPLRHTINSNISAPLTISPSHPLTLLPSHLLIFPPRIPQHITDLIVHKGMTVGNFVLESVICNSGVGVDDPVGTRVLHDHPQGIQMCFVQARLYLVLLKHILFKYH